jgi:hypothetical protein
MTRRLALAALAAGVLASGLLAGCAPAAPTLSPDVTIMVYQPRTDIVHHRLAIQVQNGTDVPLHVVGARLSSDDFVADAVWGNESATVPAGRALDLRAPLPEVRCDAATTPVATIEFVAGDTTGVAVLPVDDPFELLPRLHREACLAEQIAEVAILTPREVILPDAVGGTTLLQPTRDGKAADQVPVGVVIDADGPGELRIAFVPNRCDPHALMEDKIGTIIPLYITTATATFERWMLPVTDAQRGDFYAFFADYCGLPTSTG